LITIGRFNFNTETELFQYAMEKYFRKIPPIPTNRYLNLDESLILENRLKLAKTCHFPSIINTLYRDSNDEIRKNVEKNDFWILIGHLQDVLGFEKLERRQFARREVSRILLVLLMFEDDLEILKEVLRNASVSIKMINIFVKLLQKRGRGKKDDQILTEATAILKEKKSRIFKAAEINKANKDVTQIANIETLLRYLSDPDKVVRKAVINIITDMDPILLLKVINIAVEGISNSDKLNQFISMSEIISIIKKRENLKRQSINYLNIPPKELKGRRFHSIADYFYQQLGRKKRLIIKSCIEDLVNFDNIRLIAYGHCDQESEIRQLASSILPLDDLIVLLKDISTPQKVLKSTLNILMEHPDKEIHRTIELIYEDESKRLWNRLKELETILQACFDVVFQSLGFNEINQYLSAVKSVDQSEKYLKKFWQKFSPSLQSQINTTKPIFKDVKSTFNNAISMIEADISRVRLVEIEHVHNMIEQIIELKKFDIEGLRQGAAENLDPLLLKKAQRIWQSALGQYLGRIKSLDEMLQVKLKKLAPDTTEKTSMLEKDLKDAFNEIEELHRSKIHCTLPHECQVCLKRGCAAERFLTEVHFILQELLDNFVEA